MLTIDADVILANMFTRGWYEITFKDLDSIKQKIEEEFPDIHVDVSRNNVIRVTNESPDFYFIIDEKVLTYSLGLLAHSFVKHHFNWRIPEHARERVVQLCNRNPSDNQ